jgi:NAD(P)-dependent dehydrogenase (short-subunit alcohol dehydrogenase family)
MDTERKVAVIAGASRGIGAALVKACRERDYRIVATARSVKPANDDDVLAVPRDTADRQTAERVISEGMARFGGPGHLRARASSPPASDPRPHARAFLPGGPAGPITRHCPRCGHELSSAKSADEAFDDVDAAIIVAGERRRVSRRGWRMLSIMRERQDEPVSWIDFYQLIWEADSADPLQVAQTIRVHIFNLRRLLAGTAWRIATRRGFGYRLERGEISNAPGQ